MVTHNLKIKIKKVLAIPRALFMFFMSLSRLSITQIYKQFGKRLGRDAGSGGLEQNLGNYHEIFTNILVEENSYKVLSLWYMTPKYSQV